MTPLDILRLIHLASTLAWPAAAALGLWRTRHVRRRRARMRIALFMGLGLVVGANSLVMALSVVHPPSPAHLVTSAALAAFGVLAMYLLARYGDELAHEERVLYALSRRHLGADEPLRLTHPLSRREIEVVSLLCQGLKTDELALRLGVSRHTAITHIRHIMRKLEATSRVDVVSWAVRTGLYDPSAGQLDARAVGAHMLPAPRPRPLPHS